MIENFDFELHKDHLDSLGQYIEEQIGVLLDEEEEAHVGTAESADDLAERMHQAIHLAWCRKQRAERAFDLLDEAGKGVVVFEDLRRVANEFFEEQVTDDDLEEMIREIDQSGDGILTKHDFYKLANHIGL